MVLNEKKYLLILLISLCFSCATVRDIEIKRDAGKSIVVIYDYNWETVYNAMRYVYRHTENKLIATYYPDAMDFTKTEKTIWINDYYVYGCILFGIFFTSINESKTKVEFVKANLIENVEIYQQMIDQIIDESKYYLENDPDAYKEYTHQKRLEEEARIKAQRKDY